MNLALNPVAVPASIQQRLHAMPAVAALQLRVAEWNHEGLSLAAPLAPNVNDKGSAFGGSLVSVMTLAAWSLMSATLEAAGHDADVYVQDSSVRYLAPLHEDLLAQARLAPGQSWDAVVATYAQRHKARAQLQVEIHDSSGRLCCTLEGRFVALVPKS